MVWRTLAAHNHASNLPKRHVMRVRRVMNVVAALGCDARMHVTNMLATTRAMRALCVHPSETPCCRNGDLPPDAWECEWMCPYQHWVAKAPADVSAFGRKGAS